MEVGIEYVGEHTNEAAALACANMLIAAVDELLEFPSDINRDDTLARERDLPGGGTKKTTKRLRTGNVKNIVRSFKTTVPLTKLVSTEPAVREYLLYTILSVVAALGERIHLPPNARCKQYTSADWEARGKNLVRISPGKYTIPTQLGALLREG